MNLDLIQKNFPYQQLDNQFLTFNTNNKTCYDLNNCIINENSENFYAESFFIAGNQCKLKGYELCYFLTDSDIVVLELQKSNDKDIQKKYSEIIRSINSYTEVSIDDNIMIWCKAKIPHNVSEIGVKIHKESRIIKISGNKISTTSDIVEANQVINDIFTDLMTNMFNRFGKEAEEERDDEEILLELKKQDETQEFATIWTGSYLKIFDTVTDASLALISILSKKTKSPEQIKRLFMKSELATDLKNKDDGKFLQKNKKFNEKKLQFLPEKKKSEKINSEKSKLDYRVKTPVTYPPTKLGDLARYIYDSSMRQVNEISILGSIFIATSIAARNFQIPGSSLNTYLLLVANTGVGKDEVEKARKRIYSEIEKRIDNDSVWNCMGPSNFGSGEGACRFMATRSTCFGSLISEFSTIFSRVSNLKGTTADESLKRILLNFYDYGATITGEIVYSDEKKNIPRIDRGNMSIFGETNPVDLYNKLNDGMISSGLLPRFLLIEYDGDRNYHNEGAFEVRIPENLIEFLTQLYQYCKIQNDGNLITKVQFEKSAIERLKQIDIETTDYINENKGKSVISELYNRVNYKTKNLAGILSVFDCKKDQQGKYDCSCPILTLEHIEWSYDLAKNGANMLIRKFIDEQIGNHNEYAENHLCEILLKIFKEFEDKKERESLSYKINEKALLNNYVPLSYLLIKTSAIKAFKNHKAGSNWACKNALKILIEHGKIYKVDERTLKANGMRTIG